MGVKGRRLITLTNRPLKKNKPKKKKTTQLFIAILSFVYSGPFNITLKDPIFSFWLLFSTHPTQSPPATQTFTLHLLSSTHLLSCSPTHAYTGVIHPACFLASVLEDNVLIAASLLAVINCSADVSPHPCLAAGSDPGATLLPVRRASSAIDAIESESLLTDLGSGTTTTPIPVPRPRRHDDSRFKRNACGGWSDRQDDEKQRWRQPQRRWKRRGRR